jgi:hypothetical protein
MLGPVSAVKGLDWPVLADGKWDYSVSVAEPCDLTVRLPDRNLRLKTRPILVLVQINGTVMSVHAPTATKKASMREKVDEVERILADWKARPDERMRATLDDWRTRNSPGQSAFVILTDRRAGTAPLDERCGVTARLSSPSDGGWNVVMEIDAALKEWYRARGRKEEAKEPDKGVQQRGVKQRSE